MSNKFSIIIVLLLLKTGLSTHDYNENIYEKWVIEKGSSLNIQGETNINNFQCDVTEYLRADTLFYISNDQTKKLWFTNSGLTLDIKQFDCHNKMITRDFKKALKSESNPVFTIRFLSLDQFASPCDNQSVKGMVDIGLADVLKRTEICYIIKTLPGNRISLTGSQVFSFSDFNLNTPKKLAGIVRTRDTIKVNFRLFFKAI
jgi:hypothetical protein